MRKIVPFKFRSREGDMSSAIAAEAREIVREAAGHVRAGEKIKLQLQRACAALGYPMGSWRVRAAWNGEADCWSAAAFEELRHRHSVWRELQAARADAQERTSAAIFAALADRLEATDHDFHLDEITAIRDLVGRLRGKKDGEVG